MTMITCVGISISGQGALWRTVAPVPVPASSSVPPLLGHHPLQRIVVQPHAPARAPVDQAGGGATHRAGVCYGLWGWGEIREKVKFSPSWAARTLLNVMSCIWHYCTAAYTLMFACIQYLIWSKSSSEISWFRWVTFCFVTHLHLSNLQKDAKWFNTIQPTPLPQSLPGFWPCNVCIQIADTQLWQAHVTPCFSTKTQTNAT